MILSLLLPIVIALEGEFNGYGPTKFDDSLSPKTPRDDLHGYASNHDKQRGNRGFGDLSLIDFNMETNDGFDRNILVNTVWEVLDSSHASIMTLQSARKDEIALLSTKGLSHYGVLNKAEGSIDVLTGSSVYLPIFYDTKVLKFQKNGYYRSPNEKKIIYATWAVFEHKETKKWFTVINLDLYSAFSDVTDIQMMNILADIKKEHGIDGNPIIFVGNINAISEKLQKVIDDGYVNPLDIDLNAKESPRFTMRIPVDISNNHQRDFVLIRDTKSHGIRVNYARILRRDIPTSHYPIHVILSFEKNDDGKE